MENTRKIYIDNYTTITLNGFDGIEFKINKSNDRFAIISKVVKNIAFDESCKMITMCTDTYSDGEIYTFDTEVEDINTLTHFLSYTKPCGFDNDGTIRRYEYIITIETCKEIDIQVLNEIAEQYYIERTTSPDKVYIKDNNDNILDQYYVDYLNIKFKSFVGDSNKKYFLILNHNNDKKQVHNFGFDGKYGDDFSTFAIYTDNHEINVDKLINACDEVATQFHFDNSALFRINDRTDDINDIIHEIILNEITIKNSKFRNAYQLQKTYEYLTYSPGIYGYSTIGDVMMHTYFKYYKSSNNNWIEFNFAEDWQSILSAKYNDFVVYSPISSTYYDIYEKIQDVQLDIDLSCGLSDDYVVKFCGFIGLNKFFFHDNHYDNSIYNLFNINNITLILDYDEEFKSTLDEYGLVFMPFGDAKSFDITYCNLEQTVDIYTRFYPVVSVRERTVKLLNVGKDDNFNVVKSAVSSQISKNNNENNANIKYISTDAKSKSEFENEIKISSSECELLVMNMMTNFHRYKNGNQYCALKHDNNMYEFIDPSSINKIIYNPNIRALDIVYIVHCPYGGGTLDSDLNLYRNIELMQYGSASKQNIIGIAQYGSASGGYYIDKNKTNTILIQSLIRHFCEETNCGTYSQFITDFNARAMTIRNAVVNEIRNFAMSFQRMITDSSNIWFSFNANDASDKTFLLKVNDKTTLANELRQNNKFIENPNHYLLNEDQNLCMFQTYFACLTQPNFIKNIFLNNLYEQNIYLQKYREQKILHITEFNEELGENEIKEKQVVAGFILYLIIEFIPIQFNQLFKEIDNFTDEHIRSFLQNDILSYYNNAYINSLNDNNSEVENNITYDINIYNLWKIFHRAIVPLFFSCTLAKINVMKDEIDWNNDNIDENQLINGELNRYISVLNEIFIQTIIHLYHIWKMKSSIIELAGIKENEQNDIWELLFSIIPTSWPHAKVLSRGSDNETFMNRTFLT